ncbi:MAG: PQQ-dependent sugar dehydrogenase [Mycobacteriales bacterium]
MTVLLSVSMLVGCAKSTPRAAPTWVPQQQVPPVPLPTPVPDDGGGSSQPPSSGSTGGSTSGGPSQDSAVVATNLKAPTGLAVLPDGSALVGERTTGRIVQVQPEPGKPVRVVRTITGLNTAGGGGLLDIALSGSFTEDGLIIALITTKADTRVVHFTMTGPVTPVLVGIPRGTSDNGGRLLVLGDGSILVGTSDAGKPSLAGNAASKAGKVLHIDEIGHPAPGNPNPKSPVYTSGHRTVEGLCFDGLHQRVLETEDGSSGELNQLAAGDDYGWPNRAGQDPIAPIPDGPGVGGCALIDAAVFVASLGGKDLLQAQIDAQGKVGAFTPMLNGKYGRIRTVVAAPDKSLWLTTSNRDGQGKPAAADERVLHIAPSGGGGGGPA